MSTDPRLEAVLDGIFNGQPHDDDSVDHEPDGYSQAELDQRADEAADRYEKEMDALWD